MVRELQKISFKQKSFIGYVFGIDIDDLDLTDASAVADFFNSNVIDPPVKIDYVIHCAAATNTVAIEKDPLKYYASTVIASKNVAESCAYNGIKLIHISTDYVLSELSPIGFCNTLVEFPVNQYGMHKLLAEKEVQLAYWKVGHPERLLIGRLSWLFGNSSNTFVEKLLKGICKTYANAVKSGEKAKHKVVGDAFGKPTPVSLVLNKILDSIDNRRHGVVDFQYDGMQISRHEWAMMIWNAFCRIVEDNSILEAKSISKQEHELLAKMTAAVSIEIIKSSDIDIGMRHPGLVQDNFKTCKNTSYSEYVECTDDYVCCNSKSLLSMALNSLKEEGLYEEVLQR